MLFLRSTKGCLVLTYAILKVRQWLLGGYVCFSKGSSKAVRYLHMLYFRFVINFLVLT